MWDTPVPIFDDEDEDEFISRFVELSAQYGDKFPAPAITWEIFKNRRDPEMRSNQAAMVWSRDLSILERIRVAKLNGGVEPKPVDTREQKLRKLEAIYNNEEMPVRERIKAIELHAKITGELDDGDDDGNDGRRPIVMNFGIDPRSRVADAA
jgi:hypothetical protein